MRRTLQSLADIKDKYLDVPLVYAGDIFDKWNSPPELINFAITHLPRGHSIPGQHDLPLHNWSDAHKSAYMSLVHADVLDHLAYPEDVSDNVTLVPFHWGTDLSEIQMPGQNDKEAKRINVGIFHRYCWMDGKSHPGAKMEDHVSELEPILDDLELHYGVFGDNHRDFTFMSRKTVHMKAIINCGGFMRRKSDEITRRPSVKIIMSDWKIKTEYLDLEGEVIDKTADTATQVVTDYGAEVDDFLEQLNSSKSKTTDVIAQLREFVSVNKLKPGVSSMIHLLIDEATK